MALELGYSEECVWIIPLCKKPHVLQESFEHAQQCFRFAVPCTHS